MTCPNCNNEPARAAECPQCDGIGRLCDRCHSPADQFTDLLGQDTCQSCDRLALCENCATDIDGD